MLSKESKIKLQDIFKQYKEIKVAFLFGSYADDKENKLSDLDLGILLENNYNRDIKLDILSKLTKNKFCNVDLVIINHASLLTRFEIVKHNKVIYKREDFDYPEYFSLTIRKFLDFRPCLQVQGQYLKERILNGK